MDITFKCLINVIILIYLDDLIVFSKSRDDHFDHLEKIFQKFQQFEISLNPKKCVFGVPQSKLLGFIVSKEGIAIDPKRVRSIMELPLPVKQKGLQSFLGKINFINKFISNFVGIVRPISLMLKKIYLSNGPRRGKRPSRKKR